MRNRTGKRVLCATAGAVVAMTLAACGDESSDGVEGTDSSGVEETDSGGEIDLNAAQARVDAALKPPATIASAEFGAFTPPSSANMWIITCPVSIAACKGFADGAAEAADVLGYSNTVCDAFTSPDAAATCFTQALDAGADAIITIAVGTNVANDGYAAAKEAGVPVVAAFSGDEPGSVDGATQVAGEVCQEQGRLNAAAIIAEKGSDANTLYLGETTFGCAIARQAGFLEDYEKYCPDCKLIVSGFVNSDSAKTIPGLVQSALAKEPDLNYIAVTNDDPHVGIVVDTLAQAGKTEDISLVSNDGGQASLANMKKGYVQTYDVLQAVGEGGWAMTDAAARLIAGEPVPPDVPLPALLVNKETLETIPLTDIGWMGTEGYEDQFRDMWGVN